MGKYDIMVSTVDILAEFPMAWLDRNIEINGSTQVSKEYLHYLYSPVVQTLITHFYYRVDDLVAMAEIYVQFPQTRLFRVKDKFGYWSQVMKTHFSIGVQPDQLLAAGRK